MADNTRVLLGPSYVYDNDKTLEENWETMRVYYAQHGIEIGEMPDDDDKIDNLFAELMPQFDKIYEELADKRNES